MTQSKQPHSLSVLKNTLAVLGASVGVSMAPVAFAADPPPEHTASGAAAKAAGDGSVRGLLPAVKTAPQGANQQKGKCNVSAPAGAGQYKCDSGDGALIGLLKPVGPNGAQQHKIEDNKSTPQGAQQIKLDGAAKPKTGQ